MVLKIFQRKKSLALTLGLFAVVLCVSLNAAHAEDAPASMLPPEGIVPTTMTLSRLFALHHRAQGTPPATLPKTRIELWDYTAEGLSGTEQIYVSGLDRRETDTLGPFESASGELTGKKWRQNENGLTLALKGVHQEDEVNAAALKSFAKFPRFVRLLGETSRPVPAYVVELNPPGGRCTWLFYDKATQLVDREEALWEDRRITTTYDDFRQTSGVTEPWHIHVSDGRAYNDSDYKLQTLQIGVPIEPSKLSIPGDRRAMYDVPGNKTTLPATIIDDQIVVPVKINGHSENFQLDSGASGIVIDHDIATKIGLKDYGRSTGATAGTYVTSRTIVPQATVGDVQLNALVIETLPFEAMLDSKTRVVGLLGFDFIAGSVLHIDYLHGTLEAISASTFVPPQGALTIPVALDDGVPFVGAAIGKAHADHFIVDTGAFRSMLFSTFAKKNPAAVADQGLGDEIEAAFPFVNHITGVGGKIAARPRQVKDLEFAGLHFPTWLFLASQHAQAFEGEDADGLIGQDVLRNFDVYLDYPHQQILLVPNERYYARWPKV